MSTAEEPEQPGVRELSVQLDAEAKDVLDELIDGEQHTTYLRKTTGLSRQALHRRLDTLEDLGVIDTEKKQPAEGGQARKHARLTDRGEGLVDDGLIEGITDTNQNVETLHERVDELGRELRSELDKTPSRYDMQRLAEDQAEDVREEFTQDVQDLRDRLENIHREANRAKEMAAEAGKEDLSRTVDRLETKIEGLESRFDRVEPRAEEWESRLAELEQGCRRRDRQIEALLTHVSRLCREADARDERIDTAEANSATAKRTVRREKERMSETLEEAVHTVNRNADRSDKQIRGFDRRLNRLENALEDATDLDKSIREYERRIQDLREECHELRRELREAKDDGGLFF
jgi:chromosome segregation ATPase